MLKKRSSTFPFVAHTVIYLVLLYILTWKIDKDLLVLLTELFPKLSLESIHEFAQYIIFICVTLVSVLFRLIDISIETSIMRGYYEKERGLK